MPRPTLSPRAATAAFCLVALICAGAAATERAAAAATNRLDPFRAASGASSGADGAPIAAPTTLQTTTPPGASLWNPVRPIDAKRPRSRTDVAQAEPAPPEPPPPSPAAVAEPPPSQAAPPPAAARSIAPSPPTAPVACQDDDQCPDEHFCQDGTCHRIERRVNVFYLYYQAGTFTEALGLYWSKRGPTGFTVIAPFYWSFFSPTSRSRIVAPFYWHFEDSAAHRTSTVIVPILPVSWSRQPGASSFGIWPLFYASTKFGWAAPLLGSFKVADPDRHEAFGSVAYLYWWSRSSDHAFDLLFPVFASTRSKQSALTFALPLNFYWRTGSESHTLAIPFALHHGWKTGASVYTLIGYSQREGKSTTGAALWLYWYGRDRGQHEDYDVLFPLLWSFRGDKSGTTVFFPLAWDFRGPTWRTTIALPFAHIRSGGSWFNAAFPLWWSGGSAETGWRFQMLLPLFFWKGGDHGKTFSLVSLLGGYSRDDTARSKTLFLLTGPILIRRDPERALDIVTPFYVRHYDKPGDATTRSIGALLYLRDDPRGSTSVLFPIFWRFRDAVTDTRATALLPFFFHRSGSRDGATYAGVLPLWFYHRTFADGGWAAGLFPLAFFGHRGAESHAVVFPLFWRLTSAKASTTALFPIFFVRSSGDRGDYDAGLLPLVFFGSHAGSTYAVQFPLFWHTYDAKTQARFTYTPLGFFRSSPEGWSAGVGPLVPIVWAAGGGPRRRFVLFPIFWHTADDDEQESTTVAALYMHRRHGGELTDALFPVFHYRRGARPGGADETSFTLLPFVHYRRDAETRMLITPVGASITGRERSGGFVGPYVWYKGPVFSAAGIPGLYADITRADTHERTRQFGPLFAIDAPGRKARLLLPLFGRYVDANETDTYVFPTYFRQRRADGYAVDALPPLFWHSRWKDRTTTVVGPWYRRQGGGVYDTGTAPFYFWAKNGERTVLVMPPLLTFWRHDFKNDSVVLWAGPVFHERSAHEDATVVFPLFWSWRTEQRRDRVLFPLYFHVDDPAANRSWTLVPPIYVSRHGTDRTRAIVPLAWYTRDDVNKSGTEALVPLFYASHSPTSFTLFTLLAGYSKSPTSRHLYVGPVYAGDSVETSTRVVFPLYFGRFNRVTEQRTRLFVPLLHFSRSTPEKSLSTWLALYWRRADVASATTLILPVFLDVHDYRWSRTTVFFPLLLRHANEVTGENIWLAPLYYRHTTQTEATNVLFPLFWDFKGPGRRTTVLFPLFAHWSRPTHAGTYVFPNIYYRKGIAAGHDDGTWRLFVPPLFDAAVERPGDFRWEILGGLFGKERIGRNHYLKLFFFTIETKKASASQTAWYGQPRRTPRAHPARGLAANVW